MVRSFAINLNKSEGAAERAARRRNRTDWMLLGVLTLLLAVVAYLNVRQTDALTDIEKFRNQRILEVKKRLDELSKEGIQVSRDDVDNLARIDKERVMWTKKLMAITETLPSDMAVTGLFYHNRQLRISAISQIKKDEKEFDKVVALQNRLRDSERFFSDFKKIQFVESRRITVDDQDILQMSFVASLEADIGASKVVNKRDATESILGGSKGPAASKMPVRG